MSDVYVYEHYAGFIECCGCSLGEIEDGEEFAFVQLNTAREALEHLDAHRAAGDRVPEYAYEYIRKEHEDLDAQIQPYVEPEHVRERRRRELGLGEAAVTPEVDEEVIRRSRLL